MNRTSFSILAGVTVVLVAAAIFSVASQPSLTTIPRDRERAFPTVAAKLNDADKISIVSNKAKFTIARSDKGWGIVEKSGYPVAFDKVKSALVGLAELKLLEQRARASAGPVGARDAMVSELTRRLTEKRIEQETVIKYARAAMQERAAEALAAAEDMLAGNRLGAAGARGGRCMASRSSSRTTSQPAIAC